MAQAHIDAGPQKPAVADDLAATDLIQSLAKGWADFRAHPRFGFFFGAIYVVAGWALSYALAGSAGTAWLIVAAAGFPLVAPFTAVGLYEVSRRREAGLPLGWRPVLGALRGRGDDQLLMMGGIIFVAFSFWMILAHGIFAIFLAESGVGSHSLEIFLTSAGLAMLLVGGIIGGLLALAFFAVIVISLPMLVDRDTDFISAIIASLAAMRANRGVLLLWAGLVAIALFVAMIPAFLGLLVVLPVLGHATWHLYRRTVAPED
ncbi:DUF2189 domain-containing protein [Qipengyuania sp.]|uniref:DUF2189 domain-containing protein n=1 Tax=Qipengyuania sp. TaxID=2004515 RepID=UPI003BAA617F